MRSLAIQRLALCSSIALCSRFAGRDTGKNRLQGTVKSRENFEPVVDEVGHPITQFRRPRRSCRVYLFLASLVAQLGPFLFAVHSRNITNRGLRPSASSLDVAAFGSTFCATTAPKAVQSRAQSDFMSQPMQVAGL